MLDINRLIETAIENIGHGGTMHSLLDLPMIKAKIAIGYSEGHLEVLISNFGAQISPEKVMNITGLVKSRKKGRLGEADPFADHFALTCNTEVSKKCFKIFIREFVESAIASGCTTDVINKCIADFQVFFAKEPFSQNQEMGLYAELLVLRELLDKYDHKSMLDAWSGPAKYKYDFALPDRVLEIKSTSGNQPQISVNGTEQFKAQNNLKLILINLLRDDAAPTISITDEIAESLTDPDNKEKFRNKLMKISGHSDLKLPSYAVREIRIFEVNHSFPSLPNSLDANEFLSRLVNVSYTIRLNGIDCLVLQKMEQIKNEI